jgi:hypothetical protein
VQRPQEELVELGAYIQLGWRDTPGNAFAQRDFSTTTSVSLLAVAKIGGSTVLLVGFVRSKLR